MSTVGAAVPPLVVALLLGIAGEASAVEEFRYADRIDLPVVGDSIGMAHGVTADLVTGELFVADTRGNRIVIFDERGSYLDTIAGGERFTTPRDVAVDPVGRLVVTANRQGELGVFELDFDGLFLRDLPLLDLPEDAEPPRILSLALDPPGERLYLLDVANLRVWIADRDGRVGASIDLAEGRSEQERKDLILGKLDVYGDRVLVTVPTDGRVYLYRLDGRFMGEVGIKGTAPCQAAFPVAAALDAAGKLWMVDQQRMLVMEWDPFSKRCLGEHSGFGGNPGYLYLPLDLTLGRDGRLYVSQGLEGRVQAWEGPPPAAGSPPLPRGDAAPAEPPGEIEPSD